MRVLCSEGALSKGRGDDWLKFQDKEIWGLIFRISAKGSWCLPSV